MTRDDIIVNVLMFAFFSGAFGGLAYFMSRDLRVSLIVAALFAVSGGLQILIEVKP